MPVMKTPGVYIVEKNAFPNSVVEVATAVPAFIGYTEKSEDKGKPLQLKPWRISSLAEYVQYFGGPPEARFKIRDAAANEDASFKQDGKGYVLEKTAGLFNLYYGMLQFFQNGGGPCYIVSVGNYGKAPAAAAASPTTAPAVAGPTTAPTQPPEGGGATAPPATTAPPAAAAPKVATKVDKDELLKGLEPLLLEQEPTMVVIPDAVLLERDSCYGVQQQMLKHCGYEMRNRVALLDVHNGHKPIRESIEAFREGVQNNFLDFGVAYYPFVHTTIVGDRDVSYELIDKPETTLTDLLRVDLKLPAAKAAGAPPAATPAPSATPAPPPTGTAATPVPTGTTATPTPAPKKEPSAEDVRIQALNGKLEELASWKPDAALKGDELRLHVEQHRELLNSALVAVSPLYRTILGEVKNLLNLLPPSAAMAGVYTMVDNTRGVWKAPANVGIAGVVKPAVSISSLDQENLNVHTTGKSVNAIRSFIGEGVLVWGGRTLAGNSLDWRYVNVRRTMIMLEESCKLAAKALVFEPNVGSTWVTIKSMVSNFLTGIWKRGGLAGATPEDAFSVHVGLGETMTPEDILEGILRVTVLVAVSRPAEFIEITFQQQMQKS